MHTVNRIAGLTWDEVAARIAKGAAAILPVGAGAKQHGLHLPLETDRIQAEYLADRLAERNDALIWPTVVYGHYPAFTDYAGSVSLSHVTFTAMMRELIDGIAGSGAARVLVLNTGISTIAPIDGAIAAASAPDRIRHLKPYDGPRFRACVAAVGRQKFGSHADEIETSIMLALAPDSVDMVRAAPALHDRLPAPGPLSRNPASPNYSASGSLGDPTMATREIGEVLLTAMVEDLVDAARS